MKKLMLFITLLCSVCFVTSPAQAAKVENTTCEGPREIFFSSRTFDWRSASHQRAAKNPCRAKYRTSLSSSDGKGDDWAPYASFYSQLIIEPQTTVWETLTPFLPAQVTLRQVDRSNPDDIVLAFRVIEKHKDRDLLHYVVLRGLKQADDTVRIYQFRVSMQADTHYLDTNHKGDSQWRAYNPDVPQRAYDHFTKVVTNNRVAWFQAMKDLSVEN